MESHPRFYSDWAQWASTVYATLPPEQRDPFARDALQVTALLGRPIATLPTGKGVSLALALAGWIKRNPDPWADARRAMEAMQTRYGVGPALGLSLPLEEK